MLTVHVGLHKTGSTSIQVALERRLKGTAVVPQPGEAQAVLNRRTMATGKAVVVSSESILGSPFDGYAIAPKRAHMLADALRGIPFTLVVYLRPQLKWLESVYVQHVQGGGVKDPEELVNEVLQSPYVRWSELVDLLQAEAGAERLFARAYSPDKDVVRDFFSVAGLGSPPAGPRFPRLNTSLGAPQIPLMRLVNKAESVSRPQRQLIRSMLQDVLTDSKDDFSPLPEHLQRKILANFRGDWEKLAEMPACSDDKSYFVNGVEVGSTVRPFAGGSLEESRGRDELARVLSELSSFQMQRSRSLRMRFGRWRKRR